MGELLPGPHAKQTAPAAGVFRAMVAACFPPATAAALHEPPWQGQQRGVNRGFRTEQLLEPRLWQGGKLSDHADSIGFKHASRVTGRSVLADLDWHMVTFGLSFRSGYGQRTAPAAGLRERLPDRAAASPVTAPRPADLVHNVLSSKSFPPPGLC